MDDKDGGPAFPCNPHPGQPHGDFCGISKREYFAKAALQGMTAAITRFHTGASVQLFSDIIVNRPNDLAELAYLYADAMLAAGRKKP